MPHNESVLQQAIASYLLKKIQLNNNKEKWTSKFEAWARPLSETEDQKCSRAENIIRSAINNHKELNELNLDIFAQGSYKANTNVRSDSDIDICVRCSDIFIAKQPQGTTLRDISAQPASLNFISYREKIEEALSRRFSPTGFESGDKAFKIKENTYRINADVVPALEYREYFWLNSRLVFRTGSCFYTTSGKFIINWPDQTYRNGVVKHDRTARRYKKVVRVLKGLRNEMQEQGVDSAKNISSFQISCLAYNVMDAFYNDGNLYDNVKSVAGQIRKYTSDPTQGNSWTEIDEIKPMFPLSLPAKRQEVASFFRDLINFANLMD